MVAKDPAQIKQKLQQLCNMLRFSGEETVVLIVHRFTGEKTILGSPAGITFLVTEKDIELKFKAYCSGWFKTGTDQPLVEDDDTLLEEDSDKDFYMEDIGDSNDPEAGTVIELYKTEKSFNEMHNHVINLQTSNRVFPSENSDTTSIDFSTVYNQDGFDENKDDSKQDANAYEDHVQQPSGIEESFSEQVNKSVSDRDFETDNLRFDNLVNSIESYGSDNVFEEASLSQIANSTELVIIPSETIAVETSEEVRLKEDETDVGHKVSKESLVCKVCNKSLGSQRNLRNHMKTHGSKTCEVCEKTFPSVAKLNNHLKTHTTVSYKCEVCDKEFSTKMDLKRHRAGHTSEMLKCQVCEVSFSSIANLRSHSSLHLEEKQFKCEVCCKAFRLKSYLREHMKTHDSRNKKVCKICAKTFMSSKGFKVHMQQIHIQEEIFSCQRCGKEFYSKVLLNHHEMRKHKKKEYPCPNCDKVFKGLDALKNHINMHTRDEIYTCEFCGQVFYRKPTFLQHLRKHRDQYTQAKCRYCSKGFNSYTSMMTHVKQNHTAEDRVQANPLLKTCSICEKVFSLVKSYRAHMNMHAGVKPHKCSTCGTGFSDASNLRVHVRTHSGKKAWTCSACNIYFSSETQLIKHMHVTHDKNKKHLQPSMAIE